MIILLLSNNYGCTEQNKKEKKIIDGHSKDNNYQQGKKVGLWKEFYKNRQIKSEGTFKDGKKEGVHKEWLSNGVLILEGNYESGLANGLMKWYHDKGYLADVGLMKNGLRHGIWKVYAVEDGKLTPEVKFNEGKQQEVLKTYNSAVK
ncbi:toxin-antitoxin system YwqK family antitoxin [Aquimarina sp. AU474]|uniref:toxin-antitoxin system YwqK family antitoxin n=1 Tax=Aquimarina sp. AU474 TaxID=2108529 RepID=UPI001356D796|nr:hypothetical protein [Aquimarina sp. AU474]